MKLRGGIGNQLFQYALGRMLAFKHKTKLKLDTSWFGLVADRHYDLGGFNISATTINDTKIQIFKNRFVKKFKKVLRTNNQQMTIQERFFQFDTEVLESGPDAYLDGWWQSEKYFKSAENIIRQDITLRNPLNDKYREMLAKITRANSVSVHIRRADYLTPENLRLYETCSLDYYRQAVAIIAKQIGELELFVFSDDMEWSKKNLISDFSMNFVSDGIFTNDQELILMSQCQHNIITNSSFSWWGAWLNKTPDKIVIAPQKWFKDGTKDTRDLIPASWLKI